MINADDQFYNFHKKLAQKNIKVFSFLKKEKYNVCIKRIVKKKKNSKLFLRINDKEKYFYVRKF